MKVKIKQFAELQNIEFETPVKIEGKNKLGKTTILNAVAWCLFGKDINGEELGIRIYANEDELAEKKAEVEVFFGETSFCRKSSPTFTRGGELKSRVNTELFIDLNNVNQSDWDKFFDFKTFKGTKLINIDLLLVNPLLFLNLNYKDKKIILNEIAVKDDAELGKFDLKAMQDKKKTLKKQINENAKEQDAINSLISSIIDREIEEIPENIKDAHQKYLMLSQSDNTELIAKINNDNALLLAQQHQTKTRLLHQIEDIEDDIRRAQEMIEELSKKNADNLIINLKPLHDISEYEDKLHKSLKNFNEYVEYSDVKEYYKDNKEELDNEDYVKKILYDISVAKESKFNEEKANCPITNAFCEIAKNNAEESFYIKKENDIKELKSKILAFFGLEMDKHNSHKKRLKDEYDYYKKMYETVYSQNLLIIEENKNIEEKIKEAKENFEKVKQNDIERQERTIKSNNAKIAVLKGDLAKLEQEPIILKKLPEATEISVELRELNEEYERLNKEIIGNVAINENNAKIKDEYNQKKKELKKNYISLVADFEKTSNEIIEYTEKISKKLKNVFDGKYDLSFELFSETLDGEINDDVCNIYANGQVYLNEATTVNVGMQILYGLQKFYGKSYTVLLDRAESVNDIDTYDLDIIYTKVTEDNKLKFTQI